MITIKITSLNKTINLEGLSICFVNELGKVQILHNHSAMVSNILSKTIKIEQTEHNKNITIENGYLNFKNNICAILCDSFEMQ